MKRLTLGILLVSLISLASYAQQVMYVWEGGQRTPFSIESVDSITFVDTTATVVTRPDDTKRNLTYLFDIESVPEVCITLTARDWNTYLGNFDKWEHNGLYVPAQFTFSKDGFTYHRDSVGLRPRGNTSRRRPEGNNGDMHHDGAQWHHAHFGVKFTEYTTGERFFGCDRLILKWHKDDAAYCREIFCYDLFHRFGVWSAPHASYCRFSIRIEGDAKPVYMGVYELIENPRKGWLDDRLKEGYIPDKKGNMWKASWGADLSNADTARMGISDDYGLVNPVYDLKTNKTKLTSAQLELRDFIQEMTVLPSGSDTLKNWLLQHVDIDLFLRAYAVNVMVGMWDDYWCNQNNYLFYFDSKHRFYFIPFDYDNTLGTGTNDFGNPGTKDMLNWGSRGGDRILMRKVLSIKEFEDTYKQYIKTIATDPNLMQPAAAKQRIRHFQSLVRDYISNDTGEDMTIIDKPASWGSFGNYRLLSGSVGDGQSKETNYFDTKVNAINW